MLSPSDATFAWTSRRLLMSYLLEKHLSEWKCEFDPYGSCQCATAFDLGGLSQSSNTCMYLEQPRTQCFTPSPAQSSVVHTSSSLPACWLCLVLQQANSWKGVRSGNPTNHFLSSLAAAPFANNIFLVTIPSSAPTAPRRSDPKLYIQKFCPEMSAPKFWPKIEVAPPGGQTCN